MRVVQIQEPPPGYDDFVAMANPVAYDDSVFNRASVTMGGEAVGVTAAPNLSAQGRLTRESAI